MAFAIVLIAFFSATQDIVIDAFRIESAPEKKQGPLASMYLAGYRIAMIVSGAGSLWLASIMSNEKLSNRSMENVYQVIGFFMIIGFISTALCKEPTNNKVKKINFKKSIKIYFLYYFININFFVFFLNIQKLKY